MGFIQGFIIAFTDLIWESMIVFIPAILAGMGICLILYTVKMVKDLRLLSPVKSTQEVYTPDMLRSIKKDRLIRIGNLALCICVYISFIVYYNSYILK